MKPSVRFWLAVDLAVVLALFILQNLAWVEVTVLVWTFETHRAFVILGALGVGIVIGWVLKSVARAHRHERDGGAGA